MLLCVYNNNISYILVWVCRHDWRYGSSALYRYKQDGKRVEMGGQWVGRDGEGGVVTWWGCSSCRGCMRCPLFGFQPRTPTPTFSPSPLSSRFGFFLYAFPTTYLITDPIFLIKLKPTRTHVNVLLSNKERQPPRPHPQTKKMRNRRRNVRICIPAARGSPMGSDCPRPILVL